MSLFYFFLRRRSLSRRLQALALKPICVLAALVPVSSFATSLGAQQLTSPYREQLASEIRGLTAKEIEDFREGRGMAFARAAELNGYPGPGHILDAVEAGQFHLSSDQLIAVQQLFEGMSGEVQRLGAAILKEEQGLETAFCARTIDATDLREHVARIAALQGELRAVHLSTHLATRALLNNDQIEHYNQVRGYMGSDAGPDQHNH
jgi:hypothetical protein